MFFGNKALRDLVLAEYVDRKDTGNNLFNAMFEWKKATTEQPDVITDTTLRISETSKYRSDKRH